MKTGLVSAFFGLIVLFSGSPAKADYFVYDVICEPTQFDDVARVIRARIYLDLDAHKKSIADSTIAVSIRKGPALVEKKLESELIGALGYLLNVEDLSFSLGGEAAGHACFRDATVTVNLNITWKDGRVVSNEFVTPIRVPGAYATKAKVRVRE